MSSNTHYYNVFYGILTTLEDLVLRQEGGGDSHITVME